METCKRKILVVVGTTRIPLFQPLHRLESVPPKDVEGLAI
jgi:hypothetical protein